MTKQIQIKTKYVGLALSEVEALHKLKDVDAAIELILRSPFGEANFRVQVENNIKTSVTGEIAYQIAKEHLTTYPDHPIFNYVIGRVPTYKSHFQPNQVTQAEKLAYLSRVSGISHTQIRIEDPRMVRLLVDLDSKRNTIGAAYRYQMTEHLPIGQRSQPVPYTRLRDYGLSIQTRQERFALGWSEVKNQYRENG